MSKMSTDLELVKMAGPVMGTRWSAELGLPDGTDQAILEAALIAVVARVDTQMSTWKPDSDLMRLNATPIDTWVDIPAELMLVLARGLEVGRLSNGAFDIGLGDLVRAWGFGADAADEAAIRANLNQPRRPTHELLELDEKGLRVRKLAPLTLDLSGIAKGYGVDQMMQVCEDFNVSSALLALDGELRAKGSRPDGMAWSVAIQNPEIGATLPFSMLELNDAAIATSGDYRHWVEVANTHFSHTMDRQKGGPVQPGIASVTVVAADCMTADAMATAIFVLGPQKGGELATKLGIDCLILERAGENIQPIGIGPLFNAPLEIPVSAPA